MVNSVGLTQVACLLSSFFSFEVFRCSTCHHRLEREENGIRKVTLMLRYWCVKPGSDTLCLTEASRRG
jgi:hypothetical protein